MLSGIFGYSFSGSRLFSGSRAMSRKKTATIRQQPAARATNRQQPVAICAAGVAKRVDPAALPLGSLRSRTQTAFSRQRRLPLGVPNSTFHRFAPLSSEMLVFCTNGLPVSRAGGFASHLAGVVGSNMVVKKLEKRATVAIFKV